MALTDRSKAANVSVVDQYDTAADEKKRVSLRRAKWKYFHVKVLSNGSYLLEPRVLVDPKNISARTLKMMDSAMANLKKGRVSEPVNISAFIED